MSCTFRVKKVILIITVIGMIKPAGNIAEAKLTSFEKLI